MIARSRLRDLVSSLTPIRKFATRRNMPSPKINKISPLPAGEAKWTELRKIEEGKSRIWEAAARKTRTKVGVDAVAIAPIIKHPNRPPSTMVILQYRPPVEAVCVEFPAGLIDEGETPEQAAVRELKEETGYEGEVREITPILSSQPGMTNATMQVIDCSPTIVSDPGLTNANMQMVHVEVNLKEGDEEPEQHLDEGEHIERVVVPLHQLYEKLQDFGSKGYLPDLYVAFFASGWHYGSKLLGS